MSKDKNKPSWETKFRRTKKWLIGLTSFLTASTCVSTGLAIYYATRPRVATVEVKYHLQGGAITGGEVQKVIKGSKIGQLPSPVKDASKNEIFDHWEDFDGKVYENNEEINKNIDVYAVYKEAGQSAATVTMELNGGIIEGLEGNQVKVVKGAVVASLPSPTLESNIFVEWLDSASQAILPSTVITGDMTVYASYKEISTSTYLLGGQTLISTKKGDAGTTPAWELYRGTEKITEGVTWSIEKISPEPAGSLAGLSIDESTGVVSWTKDLPTGEYTIAIKATKGTITGEARFAVVSTDYQYTLTGGQSLLQVKDNDPSESTAAFAFKVDGKDPEGGSIGWSVAPQPVGVSIANGIVTAANVTAGTYDLTVTGTWTDTASTEHKASAKLTLVSTSTKSQGIKIRCDSRSTTITSTNSLNLVAEVYPTTAEYTLDWECSGSSGAPITVTPTSTNSAIVTTETWSFGTYTITCRDRNNPSIYGTIQITVNMPFINSNKIWAEIYDSESNADTFYWLNIDDMCNTNISYIRGYGINNIGQAVDQKFNKDEFDPINLIIGDKVTAIPDNFCAGMEDFNSYIWFYYDYYNFKSSCTMIGKNFLQGCKVWNNGYIDDYGYTLPFNLPDTIQVIDDGFMDGCEAFQNGGGFLASSAFILPSSLTIIGNDFMNECKSYNYDITIPSTVTSVGENFMQNCYNMISTVNINCDPIVFKIGGTESYTLTVDDTNTPAYYSGVKLAGAYRDEFITTFPNRIKSSTVTYGFRNLTSSRSEFTTCQWDTISSAAKIVEADPSTIATLNHFLDLFTINGATVSNITEFMGVQRTAIFNNAEHTTKVIGISHDKLVNQPTGRTDVNALFSFEFSNVLTASYYDEYYGVQTAWNEKSTAASEPTNTDYTTSTLKAYIDYYIPDDLNGDLRKAINPVVKTVATTTDSWATTTLKDYDASLFAFTAAELGLSAEYAPVEGTAYTNPTVLKTSVGSSERAQYWLATPFIAQTDGAYTVINQTRIVADAIYASHYISLGFAI